MPYCNNLYGPVVLFLLIIYVTEVVVDRRLFAFEFIRLPYFKCLHVVLDSAGKFALSSSRLVRILLSANASPRKLSALLMRFHGFSIPYYR